MTAQQVLLNLGCGDIHMDGFVNIDCRKTPATDVVSDISQLPYPDNSIDLILAAHCLEHFSISRVNDVLREWYRVLKIGSKLIIAVPDFDRIVTEYLRRVTWNITKWRLHNRILTDNFVRDILGGQDYPENIHLCLFTKDSLRQRLLNTGFTRIERIPVPTLYQRGANLHYASMMVSATKSAPYYGAL